MAHATAVRTERSAKVPEPIAKSEPTFEQIRQRAYEIYLSRGEEPGDPLQDWLRAERELRSQKS